MDEEIEFIKMHGLNNDFIIIDSRKKDYNFTAEQIQRISKRKNIGCDQFILIKQLKNTPLMEIYNSDGSKAEACGNATRCVIAIIHEEKILNANNNISLDEQDNIYNEITPLNPIFGNIKVDDRELSYWVITEDLIAVNMGEPKFNWIDIPVRENKLDKFVKKDSFDRKYLDLSSISSKLKNLKFYVVNVGNPHIVTFLDEDNYLSDELIATGELIENYTDLFPNKINVEFVKLEPNQEKDILNVRVWERGVGETLACGTGACAVYAIYRDNLINEYRKKYKSQEYYRKVSTIYQEVTVTIKFISNNDNDNELYISSRDKRYNDWMIKDGERNIAFDEDCYQSITMMGGFKKLFTGKLDKNFIKI